MCSPAVWDISRSWESNGLRSDGNIQPHIYIGSRCPVAAARLTGSHNDVTESGDGHVGPTDRSRA